VFARDDASQHRDAARAITPARSESGERSTRCRPHAADAWLIAAHADAPPFGPDAGRGNFRHLRTEAREAALVLTLKWDVVAVCAVFLFVGAVLLGAF
jgi:hypothetical protein